MEMEMEMMEEGRECIVEWSSMGCEPPNLRQKCWVSRLFPPNNLNWRSLSSICGSLVHLSTSHLSVVHLSVVGMHDACLHPSELDPVS